MPLRAAFVVWSLWGVWSIQHGSLAALLTGEPAAARANPWQMTMATAWIWASLTPLVMWNARRIRDRVRWQPGRLLAHVVSFVVVHLAEVTVHHAARAIIVGGSRALIPLLFSVATFNALAYTAIVFIITAMDSERALRERIERESRLETQLAIAQFHALRAQLHPHFLFNALNAISSLIHTDPLRADRMLARISELLRLAIDSGATPEVSLRDEMEFARRYLEVERMRYGERLAVHIDVHADAGRALVPNMLLQPLLENAVRHGVAPYSRPGRVEVLAARDGDGLRIRVRDSGPGFDAPQSTGVGLSATRQRLEKLYGAAHRLSFTHQSSGFEVEVSLPFRLPDGVPLQ